MEAYEQQRGSVTLETSVVIPIFILIFLFINGIFSVVSAQNQMTHALIQSTKSMSLDSYLTENLESAAESATKFWGGLSDMILDFVRLDNNEYYTDQSDWYASNTGNPNVAQKRFVGYLAGGDKNKADETLRNMGIVGGLDGIIFETTVEGEILTVTIKYKIQYWFDFFGMGKIPMEQTIKSRLWLG